MKALLNREFVFRLEVLNNLSRERKNSTSISDYASLLSKDRRTILKNIEALKNDITHLGCEKYITIISTDESTVFVDITPDFDTNYFLLYYLEQSVLFNLCIEIFNGNFVDLQSFATQHFYSYSTVYRKAKELNHLLQQYDLILDLNTTTYIIGREQNIRFFFFTLFWESYKVLKWPFKDIEYNELKKILEERNPEMLQFLIKPNMVFIWFAVTITRITNGYIINEEYDYTDSTFPMLSREKFLKFFSNFTKNYPKLEILDEANWNYEANFLYFTLLTSQIYPLKLIPTLKLTNFVGVKMNNSNLITEHWIKQFMAKFDISLDINEYFYLYYNLLSLHNRYLYLPGPVEIINIFNDTSYANMDLFIDHELVTTFLNDLFSDPIIAPLESQKQSLINFYLLLISELMNNKRPVLHIAIFAHSSVFQKDFFETILIKHLSFPINFVSYTAKEIDFLITDVSLSGFLHKEIPTFVWNSTIERDKLNRLISYLNMVYTKKYKVQSRSTKD
ncbi:helix-turn-helix domain-containing protein [Enterococcus ureasiticus]|uniref:Mga helix-turn-helix domain-containing protein n=1 Tax=Enterococcus ureasiticus TaxID=903984 RepID=A0A1E5G9Z0_9ENTE|nr:helix-turn-helix domain-containing protein [Enterococcus ureasiticus]OEG09514.1 hypothetical protein BCR21_14275 [Enterococcus ureasiticus]